MKSHPRETQHLYRRGLVLRLSSRSASARPCCKTRRTRRDAPSRRRCSRSIRCGRSRCRITGCSAGPSASGSTSRTTSGSFIAARAGCTTTKEGAGAQSADRRMLPHGAADPRVRSRRATWSGHWGGPGQGYEWPQSNHGIHVDYKGNVWIGGNGAEGRARPEVHQGRQVPDAGGPHAARTPAATTSRTSGAWPRSGSIRRPTRPMSPTAIGNKRVAVLDADTGKMKRYWGAYGNKPDDADLGKYDPKAPPPQQFRNPVHCVERSNDGLVYVCDRQADRVQVFHAGRQVREGSVLCEGHARARARPGTSRSRRTRSSASSSWPTAQNEKVRIILRETLEETDELRRRRAPARPVLRRAQHRDRFEGQPLHHRNLRRQARAEIRLQRHRHGRCREPGCTVAEISPEPVGFRDSCSG